MKQQKYLQGLYSLDHNIKLYIPSTKDINVKTNTNAYITEALQLFGTLFGSSTEYSTMGSWVSNTNGLVIEKITIVESYANTEAVEKGLESVIVFANKIKKELNQEAVSVEYDNKLYFV